MGGVDVTTETVIERPRAEVAEFAGDPANAPAWYANIDEVTWETDPVVRVGAQATFVARFLGRTLRYTYEIVALAPGKELTMRTAQGPFPMATTYTWEDAGPARTRMTLRNQGEPAGFSRLLGPFVAASVRRANRTDLAALKRLLEERPR